jgi:DNA modification methylase
LSDANVYLSAFVDDPDFTLYLGDVRDVLGALSSASVDCCVTSPPYWGLRDYGVDGQLGFECSPDEYVASLVDVFRDVRRVLTPAGTLWLNLGDSYSSHGKGASGDEKKSTLTPSGVRAQRANSLTGTARAGIPEKNLVGIPWRVAFALQADGWFLRSDIIWSKPNPMPESVTDRPTRAHEYVFLLSASARYSYNAAAIREPLSDSTLADLARRRAPGQHNGATKTGKGVGLGAGPCVRGDKQRGHGRRHDGFNDRWDQMSREEQRLFGANKRSVWTIATKPYPDAHFATFPQELVEPCILAGCPEGGTVLDPFMGSGTTAKVARDLGRRSIGVELNREYAELCARRLAQQSLLAEEVA